MKLLKKLCSTFAPAGEEGEMTKVLLDHIKRESPTWKTQPTIIQGDELGHSLVLVFGKPTTAIFAHIDSIGFTVRYGKELVKLGGPRLKSGTKLIGSDSLGGIECTLQLDGDKNISYDFEREIDRGTNLVYDCDFRESNEFVQSCYLDNRLGVWSALQVAKTLENGIIAFSCWEETGGGSAQFLGKMIYEKYGVRQALISDITWVTEGVEHGGGVAISMRDSGIPRKEYINKIIKIARDNEIPFQLEVESAGGSDGNALQQSPYPWDWCFVGAPEDNVHTQDEKVHKFDIDAMVKAYQVLMKNL